MTNTSTAPKEKKVELNRKGRRRQAAFRPKSEKQMRHEANIEAGKEAKRLRIARRQEAVHVRAVIRKANKVKVVTKAQAKAAAERQRRIDARKRRHAAYLRKHPTA